MKKGNQQKQKRLPELSPTDAQFGPIAEIRKKLAPELAAITGLSEEQVAK